MQASAALYQCPNLDLQGFDVVTNKPRTEAYRAPGGIQAAFAMEQAMDALCQRLGIDALEFRKRNASVTGSPMPIGTPFPSIGLTTILDRVGTHPCWTDPLPHGPLPARPRPRARLLARHVDDLGRHTSPSPATAGRWSPWAPSTSPACAARWPRWWPRNSACPSRTCTSRPATPSRSATPMPLPAAASPAPARRPSSRPAAMR